MSLPSRTATGPAAHTDTTRVAAEAQVAALRRLSPVARLELAVDMSATVRALLRARLRATHPDWSEGTLDREVLRHTLPNGVLPAPLR
jgi:hypothetical protein